MTAGPGGNPFPPEVVAAVSRHMNDDHAADSLLIRRAIVELPVPVRVTFGHRLTERAEVRHEVVRMYREACALLGQVPRPAGQPGTSWGRSPPPATRRTRIEMLAYPVRTTGCAGDGKVVPTGTARSAGTADDGSGRDGNAAGRRRAPA